MDQLGHGPVVLGSFYRDSRAVVTLSFEIVFQLGPEIQELLRGIVLGHFVALKQTICERVVVLRKAVMAELTIVSLRSRSLVLRAIIVNIFAHSEGKQVLHVFIIALKLDLVVVELVGHEPQATTRFLQSDIRCNLEDEIGDEVEEGDDDDGVFDELVGEKVEDLEREDDGVEGANDVRALELELKGSALRDGVAQHHDRVEVEQQGQEGEHDVEDVAGDVDVHHVVAVRDEARDEEVHDEVDGQTRDQGDKKLVGLALHVLRDQVARLHDRLNRESQTNLSLAGQESGQSDQVSRRAVHETRGLSTIFEDENPKHRPLLLRFDVPVEAVDEALSPAVN